MRILIVDDQAPNRVLLSDMVSGFGFQCLSVSSAKQGLAAFQQFQPDIVLLDVLMPEMDGIEAAPQFKQVAGDVHLPLIFITALDDQQTLLRCLQAGGDDFVSKPFEPVVLEAKLLAHKRSRELSITLAEKNKALAYHSSRVEREHQIVEHIFHNSLLSNHLDYPHLQTYLSSMSMFNGDLLLASPGPLGNMYFLLGDFTGHGLSAAIGALPTAETFFSMSRDGSSVGELSREINKRLHQLLPSDMFLAAIILEISASGTRLSYWNGGMPPGLLITTDNKVQPTLQPQHLALGILQDAQFDSGLSSLSVEEGDSLLLYSDGVIEQYQRKTGMLGVDGLCELVGQSNASQLSLSRDLVPLFTEQPQRDDISLALLRCKPTGIAPQADHSLPSPLSFELRLKLEAEHIRQQNPVNRLVSDLMHVEGFARYKTQFFTLLSEAYSNALEHGLLQLDSSWKSAPEGFEYYYQEYQRRLGELQQGCIDIFISYQAETRCINFEITDSGQGFNRQSETNNDQTDDNFGRGLRLVEELSVNLHWKNQGRTVAFTLPLRD
ncbi:hypothetical protein CWE09_05085 [Aliidiomarina minuta]|uniref:Response regulatory domain-containing protein n=1 Tax=Aliidiomarina minuta TaxID=880057 RepID=A0A432W7T3_9GAMM|nr:fused response regulator/phosphatase [Aliidiomarina minuta]RUO26102.1 hypothetical protein CWE09_05085 [Aliidiomarina minuta]